MRPMKKNGVRIDDTFAEAFPMRGTAILITAPNRRWARQAATTMTGFATSVIGCGAEAGIDCECPSNSTPDGRPGVRVLMFAMSTDNLQTQLVNRAGQCVLTSPGSACFADLDSPDRLPVGDQLRYFGDGWQVSKKFGDRHFWRIPVMDGEFLCEATTGLTKKAVGGGNLLIMGATAKTTMRAAEARGRGDEWRRGCRLCHSPAVSCGRAQKSAQNIKPCWPRPMTPIARRCAGR